MAQLYVKCMLSTEMMSYIKCLISRIFNIGLNIIAEVADWLVVPCVLHSTVTKTSCIDNVLV